MSQLSKNVIHNQVCKLAEIHFGVNSTSTAEVRKRALSQAYTQLCVMQLLELDDETASDAVVAGLFGDERRGDYRAFDPQLPEAPGDDEAARSSFVADLQGSFFVRAHAGEKFF